MKGFDPGFQHLTHRNKLVLRTHSK